LNLTSHVLQSLYYLVKSLKKQKECKKLLEKSFTYLKEELDQQIKWINSNEDQVKYTINELALSLSNGLFTCALWKDIHEIQLNGNLEQTLLRIVELFIRESDFSTNPSTCAELIKVITILYSHKIGEKRIPKKRFIKQFNILVRVILKEIFGREVELEQLRLINTLVFSLSERTNTIVKELWEKDKNLFNANKNVENALFQKNEKILEIMNEKVNFHYLVSAVKCAFNFKNIGLEIEKPVMNKLLKISEPYFEQITLFNSVETGQNFDGEDGITTELNYLNKRIKILSDFIQFTSMMHVNRIITFSMEETEKINEMLRHYTIFRETEKFVKRSKLIFKGLLIILVGILTYIFYPFIAPFFLDNPILVIIVDITISGFIFKKFDFFYYKLHGITSKSSNKPRRS